MEKLYHGIIYDAVYAPGTSGDALVLLMQKAIVHLVRSNSVLDLFASVMIDHFHLLTVGISYLCGLEHLDLPMI